MATLFDKTTLAGIAVSNRFVRSATWMRMADEEGHLTDAHLDIYRELAEGGVGLIITGYAFVRSEESRLESLADPASFSGLDENDPKSIGRWMRKMSSEIGEDLGGEFNEVVDRLEAGEDPESIEKSIPDLGGAGGAGDDWFGD